MQKLIISGKEINTIGFFGLGKTTEGMLAYFKEKHPHVSFVLRSDKPIREPKDILGNFFAIYSQERSLIDIKEDILFLSPSVHPERFSALSNKLIISSDAEYFFNNAKCDTYAITGSDGKSTTAKLTSLILKDSYEEAFAIGNIGASMTPFLKYGTNYAAVCELSSFQLSSFSPNATRALITNITPNHLDWHSSYDEYKSAKENILKNSEKRVFNLDSDICRLLSKKYPAFAVYSTRLGYREMTSDFSSEYYVYIDSGYISCNGERLLPTDAIRLPGKHGIANYLAAAALCSGNNINDSICETAHSFVGLSHRCESIGVFFGVEYIDSSIDTSPKRTITTLTSFSKKLIVILGGKSKGLDYSELIPTLKECAKAIILTGETGIVIKELLDFEHSKIPAFYFEDFDDAVTAGINIAKSGDTVILSPASTSFDRFSDFEERGEYFKRLVKNIYN